MRKKWRLGKRREGVRLESHHHFMECLSFQIQAFDPELWVWGRDRALFS